MKKFELYCISISLLLVFGCNRHIPEDVYEAYSKLPDVVDFNYHVKPILSDKCFACHGPDMNNQKAGLRLDIAENAYEVLKSGERAIVPKNLKKSEVIHRIFSEDAGAIMPPPEFNVTLTKQEKATIAKWIEQGATYKPHWSFIKPEKSPLPKIKNTDWAINDIDYFIANKLDGRGLKPSEKAAKATLIRRLSFGLTGLPPSAEDIENFVNNNSKNAYEDLIDTFLASPAYGERMATNWMDVARYADSDGYLDDKHRDFSPWRNWVINAFNSNIPYNKFVTMQLAGDLLPNANTESILATAFNRLHRKNSEAGIVFEEFRVEYVADRTATVSKAFLGLSIECARCHDHKYDPISQKDHYKMFGFFNSTKELGTAVYGPDQTPGPSLLLTDDEQNKLITYLNTTIADQEKRLEDSKTSNKKALDLWVSNTNSAYNTIAKASQQGITDFYNFDNLSHKGKQTYHNKNKLNNKHAIIKEPQVKKGAKNNGVFINNFTTIKLPKKSGWFDHTDPFSIELSIYPNEVYEEAGVLFHCENLRLGLKGYSLSLENNHLKFIMAFSWPTNAIEVISQEAIPEKNWSNLTITYDGSGKANGINIYNNGTQIPLKINTDNLYKSILFKPDIHTYGFHGLQLGNRGKMKSFKEGGIDELKIYNRKLTGLEILYLKKPSVIKKILKTPNLPENKALLTEFYNDIVNTETITTQKELKTLRKTLTAHLDSIPEIMVLGDLPKPRPTYVLDRGVYDAPTDEVQPGVPEAVLPFDENLPKNRLGLSKWLFNKNNPLTARVFVNRIWQMHFGRGIVATSDDFGNQGSLPSHPKLLDWLAITFMESGWDIKKLHKTILMSAAYQQNSKITPELLEIDTENTLLARGPSFRLPAEMIRDNALAISGLLNEEQGGRSVYPYQPKGLWNELSNKKWRYRYLLENDDNLYRRSLYTIWKRTSPPPSMTIFDVGDRSVCSVKRRQTSTPLQALVLLNDPQFLEAGRVMAVNLMNNYENDTLKQLQQAFKLSIGRTPKAKELKLLQQFYDDELKRFLQNEEDAIAYLNIGKSPVNENVNKVKTAALANVINGIMNTTDAYMLR